MYPSIFNSFLVIRTAIAKKLPFSRTAAHIFVSPGDAPATITQYSKNRNFYHIFCFPWGRPWGNHAKCCMDGKRRDAYKLSRCMCQSIYYHFWDTAIYLWKNRHFIIPLAFDAPVRGFPSEYRHPLWDAKTRMVSLSDGEKISKISLFVLTWSTNVTDRQTDRQTMRDSKDRACIASRGKNVGEKYI